MRRGGGEQVALCFHKAFPEAPIYTIAYQPDLTYPEFKECVIVTSWFQKIAYNEKILKAAFFPLGLLAMKQLDVSEYDVILMSSTYCAKYVKVNSQALVINYCHSPFRLAWYPESYGVYANARGLKKWLLKKVIGVLRKIDLAASVRTDYFIANAREMALKIEQIYKPDKEVTVLNPPVEAANFYVSKGAFNYFLVVSRLEYYKRIDIVIEAFNKLQLPLIVVGKGSEKSKLQAMAGKTIIFKEGISKQELSVLYSECLALIFPQVEDYGITPLEANASGRPVIAFGKGGVIETMIPYKDNAEQSTAIFFEEQTSKSLTDAINLFDSLTFDPQFIRSHAQNFDTPGFIELIQKFVSDKAH